jgi:hypothetical protein
MSAAIVIVALVLLGPATASAERLFADLPAHSSTGNVTDRNDGRNFLHLGWRFPNGFMISGGSYAVARKHCFESLTIGKTFRDARWDATLTGHGGGSCSLGNEVVDIERNLGACGTRLVPVKRWFTFGIGACLWDHGDYAVGNYVSKDPVEIQDERVQLTAMLLLRFNITH